MAKQVGPLFFTGTIDGIIFYELNGKYYIRSKGSYKSAKHMRRNPKYKRTMENADRFGMASKLAQEVYYRHVPKPLRKRGVFGQLTGKVRDWLQEGKSREEAKEQLIAYCQSLSTAVEQRPTTNTQRTSPTEQPRTSINDQRTTITATPPARLKQARYLSRWKVKPNGRLHTSQHQQAPYPNLSAVKKHTHPAVVQTE
jgi:hypothetical protein